MRTRVVLLLIVLCSAGCSYFKSSQKLDLAPFAERTVSLAADIEYAIIQSGSAHYLREFTDDPIVVEHTKSWNEVRGLLRAIVAYSIEISTLGASQLGDLERVEHFATFLDRLLREPLEDPIAAVRFTLQDLDDMLADIRLQPDFLAALKSAQPFIDELARISDLLFDHTQDELDIVVAHLHERITEENAGQVMAWDTLAEAQLRLFSSLGVLRKYRFEPSAALLDSLYGNEPGLRDIAANPSQPTSPELTAMNRHMLQKLQMGVDLKDLLMPDLTYYVNQRNELDGLYKGAQIQLKKARVTIMIWARAHRNLSEGITDPAKLDIFDLTKKAVDTVL